MSKGNPPEYRRFGQVDCAARRIRLDCAQTALRAIRRFSLQTGVLVAANILDQVYGFGRKRSDAFCERNHKRLLYDDLGEWNSLEGVCRFSLASV